MILHRTKRTIYVVLLCVALLASGFSIYNQFASDNNASQLADQVAKACSDNKALAERQGLNCVQAREVQNSGPAIIKGEKGDKGDQGERGYTGDQGAQGDRGASGSNGIDGARGEKGDPGAKGDQGAQGPKGDNGSSGMPPASWTWKDPLTQVTYTCVRSNTDQQAPTYTCD
jgi:hypothetical protein